MGSDTESGQKKIDNGQLTPLACPDPRHAGIAVARCGSLSLAGQGKLAGRDRTGHCQGWTGQRQQLS